MTRIKPNLAAPQGPELRDFRLVKPDEMTKNKNHAEHDPASLVLHPFKRFPIQHAYPAHPDALEQEVRLIKARRDRSLLLITDKKFPELWLRYAREQDEKKRIEQRRLVVKDEDHRHGEHMHELVEQTRRHFFKTVFEVVRRREAMHEKLRLLQRLTFTHIEEEMRARAIQETRLTQQRIIEGFKRHADFLRWRLDDLFVMMGNHTIAKVKGGGTKVEHAVGELCGDLRRIATGKHHAWRNDNLFITLANGGIVHAHKAGGALREKVENEQHLPVIQKRSHDFLTWHHSATMIQTPNGGMVHARDQGRMMEHTSAEIEAPKVEDRRLRNLHWHRTHLLLTSPNGGFRPASEASFGAMPEVVTGDIAWKHRARVHCKDWDWRLSNLATVTGNGGFAPQKGHFGHTIERVTADASWPKKFEVVEGFDRWHKGHMFGATPNGGFAPLLGHGRQLEAVTAQATDAPRHTAAERVKLWHATHMYKETPNGGWAPLKNVGQSIEHVGAAIDGAQKAQVVGELLARHLENLYTPTSNGSWRRVGRDGKMTEHVTAEVMRPSEGIGEQMLIANKGGHALVSAQLNVLHTAEMQAHARKKLLQLQLAGHAKTESLLTAHVTHPLDHGQTVHSPPDAAQITPKRVRKDEA